MTAEEARFFMDGLDAAITICEKASKCAEDVLWNFNNGLEKFLIYKGDIVAEALGLKLEMDWIEKCEFFVTRRCQFTYKGRKYQTYNFIDKVEKDGNVEPQSTLSEN